MANVTMVERITIAPNPLVSEYALTRFSRSLSVELSQRRSFAKLE
jgi:hypothetical protein